MYRILLAEDDDAIVRLLTDFLREEGFAVTAAAGAVLCARLQTNKRKTGASAPGMQ